MFEQTAIGLKSFEKMATELNAMEPAGLSRRELCDVTAGIAKVRGALDALEIKVAAGVDALGDRGGDAESMMRSEGGMSTREARRRKQRAQQLAKMPNTVQKLAAGELTGEHADALARAAETTSTDLVDGDARLLANAVRRPADLAGRDIRDWATKRQRPADREERYRQQRANRSLSFFAGDDQMKIALCRCDDVTAEILERRVEELARRLHRQDLKDHGPGATQTRTWEQLRHDALMILSGINTTNNKADPDGGTDQSKDRCTCGDRRHNRAESHSPESDSTDLSVNDLWRPAGVRNTILAVADIDAITGRDPNARMEIPGVGPIPKTVLDRLACDAEIFGSSSMAEACLYGTDAPPAPSHPNNGEPWSPETEAVSSAPPTPPTAKPITSSNGSTWAKPKSKTSPCYASSTTTKPTRWA